jgi:TetR/AcrR family transcriptional regulator, transcriptional repressor for nem operon
MVVSLRVIVMEARELFREYGYEGASMRDLADRVGLRPQSLYTRFPAKDALVPEVLALTLEETIDDLPASESDWREAWRLLITRIVTTFEERGRCVGLHLAYGMRETTPEAQTAICSFFKSLRDCMTGILRRGDVSRPEAVASDTLAQLEGATLWIVTAGDRAPLRRAERRALAVAKEASRRVSR